MGRVGSPLHGPPHDPGRDLVTAGVQAAIRCEHDACQAYHRGPHWHPASDPGNAVTEARMSAQANGWQVRRSHGGKDLCAEHRDMPESDDS